MAINPNNARKARHCAISMMTGGGKGIAINNLDVIEPQHPVMIYDPFKEYKTINGRKVYGYKTRRNFAKVFVKAWRSGKPFALAYQPDIDTNAKDIKAALMEHAHWFGKLAWEASDGNRILYTVFEEYGQYCESVVKENSIIGRIWEVGRKYGLRGVAIFQRSANIAKNIWENSPRKIIGAQGGKNDRERVVKELGCSLADVNDLGYRNEVLEMHHSGIDEYVKTKVHYLDSKAAGHFEKVACYVPQNNALRKKWNAEQKTVDSEGGYKVAA